MATHIAESTIVNYTQVNYTHALIPTDTPLQVRQRRSGQYCWLDTAVVATYGPVIGAYGVAVYAVLAQHAKRHVETCYPSIGTIARLLSLSRSTVKKTLRRLEAQGLIAVQPRQDGQGDPTSNLYTLLDPTPESTVPVLEVVEGGRSPENLPSVTTEPTGRASDDHEPTPPQPTTLSS